MEYIGKIEGEVRNIYYKNGNYIAKLELNLDIVNHSPDGFSWGYLGSGCSQSAFSILYHLLKEVKKINDYREESLRLYMKFKEDYISQEDMNKGFCYNAKELYEWYLKQL